MTNDPQNPFAMKARKPKAERIADVLRRTGTTPEEMDEDDWLAAAALGDVPPPSDTTKTMVIGCLSMPPMRGGITHAHP